MAAPTLAPVADRSRPRGRPPTPGRALVTCPWSHALGSACDGGDARARDLGQTKLCHDRDELLDLGAASCDFEHEMLRGGVDDAGAKDAGEPQGLDALLAGPHNLDERELPFQRLTGHCQIDHAVHVDQPFELALDLSQDHWRAGGDDREAREVFLVLRLGDRQTVDVVAATREQPGDARQYARLVIDQNRQSMRLRLLPALFEKIGGAGLGVGHSVCSLPWLWGARARWLSAHLRRLERVGWACSFASAGSVVTPAPCLPYRSPC